MSGQRSAVSSRQLVVSGQFGSQRSAMGNDINRYVGCGSFLDHESAA
ncbi:hypothetical protein [Stenomitos frigidus]|nr:hypothetical protein [Stenomitos frigidus]